MIDFDPCHTNFVDNTFELVWMANYSLIQLFIRQKYTGLVCCTHRQWARKFALTTVKATLFRTRDQRSIAHWTKTGKRLPWNADEEESIRQSLAV